MWAGNVGEGRVPGTHPRAVRVGFSGPCLRLSGDSHAGSHLKITSLGGTKKDEGVS